MKKFTWEELEAARERLGEDRGSDEEYWIALVADYVETIGACSRRLKRLERGIDGLRQVKYNGGGVKGDGVLHGAGMPAPLGRPTMCERRECAGANTERGNSNR